MHHIVAKNVVDFDTVRRGLDVLQIEFIQTLDVLHDVGEFRRHVLHFIWSEIESGEVGDFLHIFDFHALVLSLAAFFLSIHKKHVTLLAMTYTQTLFWLLLTAFFFGTLIGSFLNVCIYRIPLKKTLGGRSFCPCCKKPIPFYRNVPILAFVLQRGRSACCKKPISWQYPAIELLTGVMSALTLWHLVQNFHGSAQSIFTTYLIWFLLFVCPLIVISMIDFQLQIIPDVISLPFILVGMMVNFYMFYPNVLGALQFSGVGILLGGGILLLVAEVFTRLLKKDAMGGGDIKLVAMLGAFLGIKAVFFTFFAGSILAIFYFIILAIVQRGKQNKLIPFGPFLSMGALVYWFCGEPLIDVYMSWARLR